MEIVKSILLVACIMSAIFIIFKNKIPYIFTSESELVHEVIKTLPYYILY